jgi:outer membrane protein OmpA-like peptidoglycan-associated protein
MSKPHELRRAIPSCLTTASRVPQGEHINQGKQSLSVTAWGVLKICQIALLLFSANGCLATRGWVQNQLSPINSRLNTTDAKADQALSGLQNLHLERRLVLNSQSGPTFAFDSDALTANAKREINGFVEDLQGSGNLKSRSERLFVVAGYTDSSGTAEYNYTLGQRRANSVAGYLISKEGVDPTEVRIVSYGSSKPIADNGTTRGRRSNRRVEILVYQEKITSGS